MPYFLTRTFKDAAYIVNWYKSDTISPSWSLSVVDSLGGLLQEDQYGPFKQPKKLSTSHIKCPPSNLGVYVFYLSPYTFDEASELYPDIDDNSSSWLVSVGNSINNARLNAGLKNGWERWYVVTKLEPKIGIELSSTMMFFTHDYIYSIADHKCWR